jgi:ABC-type phosphate/phosphonate transport system permease subunit
MWSSMMLVVAMILVVLILAVFLCIPISSLTARSKTKHKL